MLFSVEVAGVEAYVLVLVEHQSSSNRWMALRMLEYVVFVWQMLLADEPRPKRLPLVVPVVLHHSKRRWRAPTSLFRLVEPAHFALEGASLLVPSFDFLLFDLVKKSDEEIEAAVDSERGRVVLASLKHASAEGDPARWLARWVADVARVMKADGGAGFMDVVIAYWHEVGEGRAEDMRSVLESALDAQDVERIMSMADRLREEGREQGREEGRAEGRAELLLRQLELRFGALPEGVRTRVTSASMADFDRWAERILTAESVEDVLA